MSPRGAILEEDPSVSVYREQFLSPRVRETNEYPWAHVHDKIMLPDNLPRLQGLQGGGRIFEITQDGRVRLVDCLGVRYGRTDSGKIVVISKDTSTKSTEIARNATAAEIAYQVKKDGYELPEQTDNTAMYAVMQQIRGKIYTNNLLLFDKANESLRVIHYCPSHGGGSSSPICSDNPYNNTLYDVIRVLAL